MSVSKEINILKNKNNIKLSKGAIEFLISQPAKEGKNIIIEHSFIFQIEYIIKNSNNWIGCSLIDQDSKYGGFFISYDHPNFVEPLKGDIIETKKIIISRLPRRNVNIFFCEKVKLLQKKSIFQVETDKLKNISKEKLINNIGSNEYLEKGDNSKIINPPKEKELNDDKTDENKEKNNEKKYLLISSLSKFENDPFLLLRCKEKFRIKNLKKGIVQNYIFYDKNGDEIEGFAKNNEAEKFNIIIKENKIYEIKGCEIYDSSKTYQLTQCLYQLFFNSNTSIEEVDIDKEKFNINKSKSDFISISKISEIPKGSLVNTIGIILEEKGLVEVVTKKGRIVQKREIIIGDQTQNKISIILWDSFATSLPSYEKGTIIKIKNCKLREYNEKKTLNTIFNCSSISSEDKNEKTNILKEYYINHPYPDEYKEFNQKNPKTNIPKIEINFLREFQNQYIIFKKENETEVKVITGTVVNFSHSKENYYTGCAKCKKKTLELRCPFCQCENKKIYYLFSVTIADCSSFEEIYFHDDLGKKIIGIEAKLYDTLINNTENDKSYIETLSRIKNRIIYHTFTFSIKFGKFNNSQPNSNSEEDIPFLKVIKFNEINQNYFNQKLKSLLSFLNNKI